MVTLKLLRAQKLFTRVMEISKNEAKMVIMLRSAQSTPDALPTIVLKVLAGTYSIANFPVHAPVPEWANQFEDDCLVSLTHSRYGFSVICPDSWVPDDLPAERVAEWRVFRVEAPRDWALYGLYSRLTQPLADDAMSIYIVGSYNADHVLVRNRDFARAKQILSRFCEII